MSNIPTDDEFYEAIKPLWLKTKPSEEAQRIRSAISCDFDSAKYKDWISSYMPDYVWDMLDIAAQRGIELGRKQAASAARNACLEPPDGGSPTEEERVMCERIAALIEALGEPNAGKNTALLPPRRAV